MTPETKIKNKILEFLDKFHKDPYFPLIVERRQAGGFNYREGRADIYFILRGKHYEVEFKKPGGKMSPHQYKNREIFLRKKIPWICVENFDDFLTFWNEINSEVKGGGGDPHQN